MRSSTSGASRVLVLSAGLSIQFTDDRRLLLGEEGSTRRRQLYIADFSSRVGALSTFFTIFFGSNLVKRPAGSAAATAPPACLRRLLSLPAFYFVAELLALSAPGEAAGGAAGSCRRWWAEARGADRRELLQSMVCKASKNALFTLTDCGEHSARWLGVASRAQAAQHVQLDRGKIARRGALARSAAARGCLRQSAFERRARGRCGDPLGRCCDPSGRRGAAPPAPSAPPRGEANWRRGLPLVAVRARP